MPHNKPTYLYAIASMAILLIFAWFLYLRYLLAKKALEAETHIREHQLYLSRLPAPEAPILKIENKADSDILEVSDSEN